MMHKGFKITLGAVSLAAFATGLAIADFVLQVQRADEEEILAELAAEQEEAMRVRPYGLINESVDLMADNKVVGTSHYQVLEISEEAQLDISDDGIFIDGVHCPELTGSYLVHRVH